VGERVGGRQTALEEDNNCSGRLKKQRPNQTAWGTGRGVEAERRGGEGEKSNQSEKESVMRGKKKSAPE